jgi:hypothetical protein
MESMEAQRAQHNKQKVERYQQLKTEQPVAHAATLGQIVEQHQQLKTAQPVAHAAFMYVPNPLFEALSTASRLFYDLHKAPAQFCSLKGWHLSTFVRSLRLGKPPH